MTPKLYVPRRVGFPRNVCFQGLLPGFRNPGLGWLSAPVGWVSSSSNQTPDRVRTTFPFPQSSTIVDYSLNREGGKGKASKSFAAPRITHPELPLSLSDLPSAFQYMQSRM